MSGPGMERNEDEREVFWVRMKVTGEKVVAVTMREVPQRLTSPSEETPKKKKKKKNQISVSITLSNSILNCLTLALFTATAGSLFHIGAILYVKKFPH